MPSRVDILAHDRTLLSKMLRLAVPASLSMMLHLSYSVVDMFWVAKLGREAVAAVTLGSMIFFVGFSLTQIYATGAVAVFARAWGAAQQDRAARSLRDCVLLGCLTGTLLALAVCANAAGWLRLLGGTEAVVRVGIPYMRVAVFVFTVSMPFFIITSAFRSAGDALTPLLLTAVSTATNIILDPVLIFGLGPFPTMGIQGAAVATVFSIALGCAVSILLTFGKKSHVRLVWTGWPDWHALRDVFAVGLPSGAHYVLLSLIQTSMLRMVAVFGTEPLAAAGVASRISRLSFLPCMGLGTATATMVGQYLGAERPDEAMATVRTAAVVTGVVTAVLGAVYAAVPEPILDVFGSDPAVVRLGSVYLRVFAASLIFVSLTIIMTRAFQGAGDTVWPTLVAVIRLLFFLAVGAAAIAYTQLGAFGVWLAMAGSHAFQMVLLWVVFRKGTWLRRRLKSVDGWQAAGDVVSKAAPAAE